MLGAAAFLVLIAGVATASAAKGSSVPPAGFFGVVPQAGLDAADFERMQGTVGTLRVPVYWFAVEPSPGVYDFSVLDAEIGAAADHGVRVLPFVYGTPAWLAVDPSLPPLAPAASQKWASFLRVLVARYGPAGEFWADRSARLPIRRWQIWNEPNFALFWRPDPDPVQYARLLALSAKAVRAADPRAQIVLGGVAPVNAGMLPWVYLRRLYRVPGVKRNFDLVADHPYSVALGNVRAQIELTRQVMEEAGDARTPLLISELGVASSGDFPSAFVKGEAGQANFLRRAFTMLLVRRREWRIAGVDWFTWRDQAEADPNCAFCQGAGLFDLGGRPKQAWKAYRQVAAAAEPPRSAPAR